MLLFTVAPLPVVCGLTPGCWRDDLIPVRICWSYSIMRHPKSAAVDKHISLSTFYFMLFYLSAERNRTNRVKYTLVYSLLNGLYLDSSSMQETPTTLQSLRTEDISFISVGVGTEAYYFEQEAEYTSHQLITGWIYRDKQYHLGSRLPIHLSPKYMCLDWGGSQKIPDSRCKLHRAKPLAWIQTGNLVTVRRQC